MINQKPDLARLVADVVASYVSNNKVEMSELPNLVQQVYHSFLRLDGVTSSTLSSVDRPEPAVAIKKSVTPEYIICLEDGKKLKMLKRHLQTSYNMTPEQYRERWNLPSDYPMTAPSYAKERSKLAKDIGLGTKSKGTS
ncbi:MAG: MucR family transcriptional regulator [Alphaproteobacteria bacterium]|nr:MucR family transcriptional regulator [Alphaproteobacteria bacterium]